MSGSAVCIWLVGLHQCERDAQDEHKEDTL